MGSKVFRSTCSAAVIVEDMTIGIKRTRDGNDSFDYCKSAHGNPQSVILKKGTHGLIGEM